MEDLGRPVLHLDRLRFKRVARRLGQKMHNRHEASFLRLCHAIFFCGGRVLAREAAREALTTHRRLASAVVNDTLNRTWPQKSAKCRGRFRIAKFIRYGKRAYQFGRFSSHFRCCFLQFKHPFRDFLCHARCRLAGISCSSMRMLSWATVASPKREQFSRTRVSNNLSELSVPRRLTQRRGV